MLPIGKNLISLWYIVALKMVCFVGRRFFQSQHVCQAWFEQAQAPSTLAFRSENTGLGRTTLAMLPKVGLKKAIANFMKKVLL